jgi:hypothetical protein
MIAGVAAEETIVETITTVTMPTVNANVDEVEAEEDTITPLVKLLNPLQIEMKN